MSSLLVGIKKNFLMLLIVSQTPTLFKSIPNTLPLRPMLYQLSNAIIKTYLKLRFKRIERIRAQSPELQKNLLKTLIQQNKNTRWGKEHQLTQLSKADEIGDALPISNYESIQPYINKMLHGEVNVLTPGTTEYFAKSAGTTSGKSKYLPINRKMLHSNLIASSWESMATVYDRRPTAQSFQHKNLILGGSLEPYTNYKQSIVGDVSAIMLHTMPGAGRPFYCPDFETALMPNWEEKIELIAQKASKANIVMIAGVPTWNLVLFQRVLEITGKANLLEIWPNLRTYMHGGVGFEPYREQFRTLLPTDDFDYMEIYNASEGYFSIQDTAEDGMLLLTDHGVYYEFVHIIEIDHKSPNILRLDQVEKGEKYAMLISTFAGLWRYMIGDTVQFVSTSPYRIKVIGRTQHYINVFGEEVMVGNTDQAIAETCLATKAVVKEYTVGPIYMTEPGKGGHQWLIEFDVEPKSISEFEAILDHKLQDINSDYEAKRYKNMALGQLKIDSLPNGSFHNWLKSKGRISAQVKVPRLSNTRKYINDLLSFIE